MRIAITGASGFVGKYVLRELQKRDLDIIVAGRSSAHVSLEGGRTNFVGVDIAQEHADPFTLMGKPDVLIHLAWGGLPNYQSSQHIEVELPLHQRFLSTCLSTGLRRLVVAGTCYEYGLMNGQLSEEIRPNPCTQYGIAKDLLRRHLEERKVDHPFHLSWPRLFYLYGPGQSKNSLYSLLMEAIHRQDSEFCMSGGDQVRDFMPIEDAARSVVDIALLSRDAGVVNVCSGVPTTIRDLVARWIKEKDSRINMSLGRIPYSDFEPMSFWGDRSKLDLIISKNITYNPCHIATYLDKDAHQ